LSKLGDLHLLCIQRSGACFTATWLGQAAGLKVCHVCCLPAVGM
jgi:hypothetical protein